MKDEYIRQVEQRLPLAGRKKKEIVRDLREIFASAAEHGETERDVIDRLGTPRDFAARAAEELGGNALRRKNQRRLWSIAVSLVLAAAVFAAGICIQIGKVPAGAIGYADGLTHIQIERAFAVDMPQILLWAGAALTVFAAVQFVCLMYKRGEGQ